MFVAVVVVVVAVIVVVGGVVVVGGGVVVSLGSWSDKTRIEKPAGCPSVCYKALLYQNYKCVEKFSESNSDAKPRRRRRRQRRRQRPIPAAGTRLTQGAG